jgi:hypothetical protein
MYHQVDIVIVDNIEKAGFCGPLQCLYENPKIVSGSKTKISPRPINNDSNFMMSMTLFTAPRFVKSLFRNNFVQYRVWPAVVDLLLVLLYEKYSNWKTLLGWSKLKKQQSAELFRLIRDNDKEKLKRILPDNNQLDLINSLQDALSFYVDLSTQKASALKQELNIDFSEHTLSFLKKEISRYRG